MTDTTTRARALLEAATPLPWTTEWDPFSWSVANTDTDIGVWAQGVREQTNEDASYRLNRNAAGADAALIVHAVNHLPEYLAAVDALWKVIEDREHHGECPAFDEESVADCQCGLREARAALSKLRESE